MGVTLTKPRAPSGCPSCPQPTVGQRQATRLVTRPSVLFSVYHVCPSVVRVCVCVQGSISFLCHLSCFCSGGIKKSCESFKFPCSSLSFFFLICFVILAAGEA